MNKEMLQGSIDLLLLSLISQREHYGYELDKKIREKSDDFYEIGEGTLYPALKRLETGKAIESYWGESAEGDAGDSALRRQRADQSRDCGIASDAFA